MGSVGILKCETNLVALSGLGLIYAFETRNSRHVTKKFQPSHSPLKETEFTDIKTK